jgi:hypothetical protein
MSEFYQPGEIVDITIKGARVKEVKGYGDGNGHCLKFEYALPSGDMMPDAVFIDADAVTVERGAPAEWPPQPGDEWAGPKGERWFAMKYYGDYDLPKDYEGCNSDGWRVVLMPMEIGPYGDSEMRPDDALRTRGPLTPVHREEGEPS